MQLIKSDFFEEEKKYLFYAPKNTFSQIWDLSHFLFFILWEIFTYFDFLAKNTVSHTGRKQYFPTVIRPVHLGVKKKHKLISLKKKTFSGSGGEKMSPNATVAEFFKSSLLTQKKLYFLTTFSHNFGMCSSWLNSVQKCGMCVKNEWKLTKLSWVEV